LIFTAENVPEAPEREEESGPQKNEEELIIHFQK
jgi:hypothetical protein